jgi:hypothetical protein
MASATQHNAENNDTPMGVLIPFPVERRRPTPKCEDCRLVLFGPRGMVCRILGEEVLNHDAVDCGEWDPDGP